MADTVLENAIYIPDGRLIGTGLIASVVDTYHGLAIDVTVATPYLYIVSIFAAKGSKDWICLLGNDNPDDACSFNVSTGVKGSQGATVIVSGILGPYMGFMSDGVTPIDVYRCWMGVVFSVGAKPVKVFPANGDGFGNVTFAGDGATVSAHFWGAQVELGFRPSSPIITAGAAATRLSDELIHNSSLAIGNFDKGTIICNVVADAAAAEEGTLITLAGASNKLVFHTDSSEHISMKTEPNPS